MHKTLVFPSTTNSDLLHSLISLIVLLSPQRVKKRFALKESDCQNTGDFQALCHKLRNWDKTEKFVGSALTKEFKISGTDAGHKIKLLDLEMGTDIPGIEVVSKSKRSWKRYQNSDVSMPAPPRKS